MNKIGERYNNIVLSANEEPVLETAATKFQDLSHPGLQNEPKQSTVTTL